MADEERVLLTQDELDNILSGVRSDNAENKKHVTGQNAVALSQAELDNLFGNSNSTMRAIGKEPEPEKSIDEKVADIISENPESTGSLGDSANPSGEKQALTMAEKIAARKARTEELLKKVNAQSPKRISVVYGSTLSTGEKINQYKIGSVIELDREMDSGVDVFCDGKLIARGFIGKHNGKAAVRITSLVY